MSVEAKERLQLLRRWKNEGALGARRAELVEAVREHRNAMFCEQAGYMLRHAAFDDWNAPEAAPGLPPMKRMKTAVLGSFTCEAFPLMLRPLLLCEGVWPDIYAAGYNQYVYELMNADSELYRFEPQLTVCLLDERTVLDELAGDWSAVDLEAACERKLEQLRQLMGTYHARCQGLLMFHTIPMSPETYNTKIDYKTKAQIGRIWRLFNNGLLDLSEEWSQVITIDAEVLFRERSVARLNDPRLSQYGSFHLGQEALFALAEESVKVSRALLGLTKKALVLDLDNTLWGGVVGDDGIHGVQLGESAPGKTFLEFQKAIKQWKNQGVLLTVSSKNEEAVAREMFERHPHMQIRWDDIVWMTANWKPKAENIAAMAKTLNIGLDSMVFVDDNPFERELVRTSLPGVTVPEMPEDPAYYKETLLSAGWFNTIQLTSTDLDRTSQYKTEAEREQLKQSSGSVEDYLRSLRMEVKLLPVSDFHLPRLAQLTMRTNQFNMTTRRYQESEIERMERCGRYWVFGFQALDRFGDYGLIGCVLIEKAGDAWRIDNFLMSCRVFSRSIETAVIRHVLMKAKESGAKAVIGEYIPTAKNVIVKHFYVQHGFEPAPLGDPTLLIDAEPGETTAAGHGLQRFVHRLDRLPDEVDWIRLHTGEEVIA